MQPKLGEIANQKGGPSVTRTKLITVLFTLGWLYFTGCTSFTPQQNRISNPPTPTLPPRVAEALNQAGSHGAALRQVLEHYRQKNDTLGYQAACFLIANMPGKAYAVFGLFDTTGREIPFDPTAFPSYDSLKNSFHRLEKQYGPLDFKVKTRRYDLENLDPVLLEKHIDYALQVWRSAPWARFLSKDQFFNYVLPYRGSGEPVENWRPYFINRYADSLKAMHTSDPTRIAAYINRELRSWFRFDPRFYYHPTDQSFSEMFQTKMGRCEDMTNLSAYAMRANGLAVATDYTPFWATTGNNHAWNVLITPQGAVPFMGCEADPGKYKLGSRPAKVYRQTFAYQYDNLPFHLCAGEQAPHWLGKKNALDVTADYVSVSDVTLQLDSIPDSTCHAYLCVFNDGEWHPIHWGTIENGSVTFTDMGRGIIYLPAFYRHKEVIPAGPPFILEESGTVRTLTGQFQQKQLLKLWGTATSAGKQPGPNKAPVPLKPGHEYELFYWQNGWVSAGKQKAGSPPLTFEVPRAGLYWLVDTDGFKEERVFEYRGGECRWW